METKTFARLFDGLAAAPWVHGSLPHAVPFSRRVHGRMLVWPRDMDAFAGGTIPAADLPPDEVTATTATAWIKHRLLPDDGFYLELAHGAIDRQGRVDVLLPMDRPAGCFGTLVVFPSSTCMGGAITVAHENRTTVFTPPAGASSFLAFYNSCTVNVSPLVGTRAILIYHVVYLGPTDRDRFVPIAAAPLIARLKKAAASANQDSAVYAFKWRTRYGPELDFSALEPHDAAIVDALCATEAYDVALVRVTVQGRPANAVDASEEQMGLELMTQSFEEADERYEILSEVQHMAGIAFVRMGFAGPAITIVSALYHPACNVPAELSLAKIQLTDFVGSRTMVVLARGGSPFLIFWPKRHRARLLGFERCMQLLWSSVADGCNMNSIDATVSCMARGAMEMLLAGRHALPGLQRAEPDSHQMCSFLADLGDIALIAAFINTYANVKKHASWLFDMLDRLGWEALRVAVLWRLRSSRLEEALSFLGTLIEDNQLRLRQPFAVEFLKEMWATVRPTSFFQLACIEACPATLVHGLRIESCIVSASNDNVVGPYLRLCLPNSLIAHIDAFLYPATLLDIVTATPHVFDPVEVVAKAIVQLCNEELSVSLRPYIALVQVFEAGTFYLRV
ncbi:hypothetical protein SDRG_15635 [Saprolegnia diclina VS20]|uniref:Uncharacterized protein n=1 Tax=Saprolegnia diclina (strain VS20) TaxID=1156394 RepID=T0R3C4_SAPDV|nr:hypothetical protein SDRG_15635 [Saprolegnia diclina VS20]EQC26543.1 hypothetical protein SDRG_15635 [Saprolegnia diclina VS20]|eukprot:XP_008620036.1 hypothetical protein SDRG_15635 [Saprolegnia diclina VS20]